MKHDKDGHNSIRTADPSRFVQNDSDELTCNILAKRNIKSESYPKKQKEVKEFWPQYLWIYLSDKASSGSGPREKAQIASQSPSVSAYFKLYPTFFLQMPCIALLSMAATRCSARAL